MIVAKQDLIIFGKLFLKGEKITNVICGKMFSREEIEKKLQEKKYIYEIVNEKIEPKEKNFEEDKIVKKRR